MNLDDYTLPENWQFIAIEDAYRFTKKPGNLSISNFDEVPFIPMELVPSGKIYATDCIMKTTKNLGSGTYFENGDLLVAKITPSFENGKQAIAKIKTNFGYATTEVIPIKGIENFSDEIYLHFVLLHPEIRKELAGKMDGSTGRQRLRKEVLARKRIIFPPLDEQKRISHILTIIKTAIEQQERLIALTRELKSTLMRKLFTEGLHGEPQKQTEMGLVPYSWKKQRLENTGYVIYGIQAAVANNIRPVGMKILTNKNITLDGQIILDDINYFELKTKRHFETILKKGDILFNWRSGSKQHIGKTAYFNLDGEYTHSSFILRIRPYENINGRYLFWYLYHLRVARYFLQKHDISSVNATFNKSAVDALQVFLPSLEEQEEIVSILNSVDEKITLLKRKTDFLEELFSTLLHQLMTGQIRALDIDLPAIV